MNPTKSKKAENAALKVEIISYLPHLAPWFKLINLEWLNQYYEVTQEDLEILESPERIIQSGGQILFALVDEQIVGTAALLRIDTDTVELIKMGVSSGMQGKGIGQALMEGIITASKNMYAKTIKLETATPLIAAISLYKKFGFVQTSGEEVHPVFKRITFKMKKKLGE